MSAPQQRTAQGGELPWAIVTAGVALAAAAIQLRLWHEHLAIPLQYDGDSIQSLTFVKSILDHGWLLTNPDLGFPAGQQLYDFPLGGDNGAWLAIRFLGLFSSDTATVTNLFFIGGFGLVAGLSCAVLRQFGLSRAVALITGVLFASAPYHLLRGEVHLTLSFYVAVPLIVLLAFEIMAGRAIFVPRSDRSGVRRWLCRRVVLMALACVVIGSTGIGYYPLFAIILVLGASVVGAVTGRTTRPLVTGGAVGLVIGAVLLANISPTFIYQIRHGSNAESHVVYAGESDVYAFNFARLFVPPASHQFAPFSRWGAGFQATNPLPGAGEGVAYLGVLPGLGFLMLLAVLMLNAMGREIVTDDRLTRAAPLAGLAFLTGTTGGLATLFAYLVTPSLHGFNRISVIIVFLGLMAVGVVIDRLLVVASPWSAARRAAMFAAVVALVLAGLYDQTTLPYTPGDPARTASWQADSSFVAEIEDELPAGAAVFQLPMVEYPERGKPIGTMRPYDEARGYLHSHHLRWSWGAIRGRPADLAPRLAKLPVERLLPELRKLGFSGLWVDRGGYQPSSGLERRIAAALRRQPLVSPDGRRSFFRLDTE